MNDVFGFSGKVASLTAWPRQAGRRERDAKLQEKNKAAKQEKARERSQHAVLGGRSSHAYQERREDLLHGPDEEEIGFTKNS